MAAALSRPAPGLWRPLSPTSLNRPREGGIPGRRQREDGCPVLGPGAGAGQPAVVAGQSTVIFIFFSSLLRSTASAVPA